jgi:hypothetical protein
MDRCAVLAAGDNSIMPLTPAEIAKELKRPSLKDKQPRRAVGFDITAEQYAALVEQQRRCRESGTRISIAMLARNAFEIGLNPKDRVVR